MSFSPPNAPRSASTCRPPSITASASSSCRRNAGVRAEIEAIVNRSIEEEGLTCSAGAMCPSTTRTTSAKAVKAVEPVMRQVFVGRGLPVCAMRTISKRTGLHRPQVDLERGLSALSNSRRRRTSMQCSMSCRTIVYKGMVLAHQLGGYYADLQGPAFRQRSRAGASALRDQYLPVLVAWPIPTAWSRTTARSTRCAATSTGWRRVRRRSSPNCYGNGHQPSVADLLRGPVGHRLLRQRARIPGAGRLLAAPTP